MSTFLEEAKKGSFDETKEQLEVCDFANIVDQLSTSEFAIKMHERLVKQTRIVRKSRDQFNLDDVNRVLAEFPALYSWAIVEAELIEEKLQEVQDSYDLQYKQRYDEANEYLNATSKKPTLALIESQVVKTDLHWIAHEREQLLKQGLSIIEIDQRLRYFGLEGVKRYIRELRTKAKIAKEHCRVWASTVSTLQSLSKNINIEYEAHRKGSI